jgi:hypothetical protein
MISMGYRPYVAAVAVARGQIDREFEPVPAFGSKHFGSGSL